jgi:endonuclease/exonuclease/phosphatase family metal-dependent hydrolase
VAEAMAAGRGNAAPWRSEGARPLRITLARGLLPIFTVVILLQGLRVLLPLLYDVREQVGSPLAVGIAFAVFLCPLLAAPLRRIAGSRSGLLLAIVVLAAGRLGFQILRPIPLWLAAVTVALALVALTLELHVARSWGPEAAGWFALTVLLGLCVDSTLLAVSLTWDVAWRGGSLAFSIAALLGIGLVGSALLAGRPPETGESGFGQVWTLALLGPFLLLEMLFLRNIAFADSAVGAPLVWGAVLVKLGVVLATLAALWTVSHGVRAGWAAVAGILLVASVAAAASRDGPAVAAAILLGQPAAGLLLILAMARGATAHAHASAWRTSVAVAIGTVVQAAFTFLYQIDIDAPLGFPRVIFPIVAAAAVGLAAVDGGRREPPRPFVWQIAILPPIATVAVALFLVASAPSLDTTPGDASPLRLVDWNIHSAVNADGQIDPGAIRDSIGAERPDVVVLQEIARGWPIAGETDLAQFLSRELDLPYRWAPAADGQFGNVILSRLPVLESSWGRMPYGEGPQHRSYVRVVFDAGGGRTVTVIGAHLQDGERASTREQQIATLLDVWGGDPATVIAGDMNMQPTEPNVSLFTDAGLVSAQDAAGMGRASTSRNPNFPGDRPDWIFLTPDLACDTFAIGASDASDHLPLMCALVPSAR